MLTMISTTDYSSITEKEPPIDIIDTNNHHRQLRFEDDSFKKPSNKPVKDKDSSSKTTRRRRRKEKESSKSSSTLALVSSSNNVNNPETETSLSSWKPDSLPIEGQKPDEERVLISLGSDRMSRSTALSSTDTSSLDKKSSGGGGGLSDGLAHSTQSDTTMTTKLQNPVKLSLDYTQAKSLDHDYLSSARAALSRLRLLSNDDDGGEDEPREPEEVINKSGKKKVRRRHHRADKKVKRISKTGSIEKIFKHLKSTCAISE